MAVAFLSGLVYEFLGTLWARHAANGSAVRAGLFAGGCALMTVLGLRHALHDYSAAIMLAVGYFAGTWLAVKVS